MMELLTVYLMGVAVGALVAWFVMQKRMQLSPGMETLARNAITQAVFINSVSDVVDEQTCEQIQQRANERLEELDVPGNPKWNYKDP